MKILFLWVFLAAKVYYLLKKEFISLHQPNCENSLGIGNPTPRSTVGFSIEKQKRRVYQKILQCLVQFGLGSARPSNKALTERHQVAARWLLIKELV